MTLDELIDSFAVDIRRSGMRMEAALREGIEAAIKAEREACAEIADWHFRHNGGDYFNADRIAHEIRARSDPKP